MDSSDNQSSTNETSINQPSSTDRERQYDRFVGLLARHDSAIRRFVRSLLPTHDGVDDVVQETALECWKKFSDFQPDSSSDSADEFVRWACVIARFKALSWQRDRSRDRLVFREGVIESLFQSASKSLDRKAEEQVAIKSCLSKLSLDQQRLVLSVHSPGESVKRIAEETGVQARRLYSEVNNLRSLLLECVRLQLVEGASHGK